MPGRTSTPVAGIGFPATIINANANRTAFPGDCILMDASGAARNVTLPAAPPVAALVTVEKVDASLNAVTITPAGGGTVNGQASIQTTTQFAGGTFLHLGANAWFMVASSSTTGPAGTNGTNGTNGINAILSTVQDEGSALTQRSTINFVGAGVTAADSGGKTVVTIPGGAGVSLVETRTGGAVHALPGVTSNNHAPGVGYLEVSPIFISKACTIDQLGLQVTQAGAAGSAIRLGLYADDGEMHPAALVLDAGTIAADSTGRKTIAISQAVAPGVYWLAAVLQAGSSGSILVQKTSSSPAIIPGLTGVTAGDPATSSVCGYSTNGAETGALPGTLTTLTYNQNEVPRVFYRVA